MLSHHRPQPTFSPHFLPSRSSVCISVAAIVLVGHYYRCHHCFGGWETSVVVQFL
ncbi:hypothetical protein PIB30_088801, partial [Stylosanthes scabra]|nr:hypothetical protein [Stylosanthes scabra]